MGYLKFVPDDQKANVRDQLIDTAIDGYLDTEWNEDCVAADLRSYPADNEDLAEGDIGAMILLMKPVLEREGVTLESVEDEFGTGDAGEGYMDFVSDTIDKDLNLPKKKQAGMIERPALAAVGILAVLAESIDSATYCVSKNQVERWQKKYFEWFDEVLPNSLSAEQLSKWRRIAQREFDRLRAVADGDDLEDLE